MKNTLYILLLLCSFLKVHAQHSWLWGRGNQGGGMDSWAVTTDPWGNVYAGGVAFGTGTVTFGSIPITDTLPFSAGGSLSAIVKYNTNGDVIWVKGLTNGQAGPVNIVTDPSGNLIVLGQFQGHLIIDTFNLYADSIDLPQYFLAKFDSSGAVIWAKKSATGSVNGVTFTGGSSGSIDFIQVGSVTTDLLGNIYVTGIFNDTTSIGSTMLINKDPSNATNDIFVARYDTSGNPVWASALGGISDDDVFGITVASTGNVYVAGTFMSDTLSSGSISVTNPAFGIQNAFIYEFSAIGAPLWGEADGGANSAYGAGLASDHDGNVYLVGAFGDSSITFGDTTIYKVYPGRAPYLEMYLVKFDMANNVIWHKVIGSPTCDMGGYCIARGNTEDGAVWVSGEWAADVTRLFVIDSASVDGNILFTPDSSTDPVFLAGYDLSGAVLGYAALQSGADDQNGIASDGANVYLCADYVTMEGNRYFTVGPDTFLCDTGAGINEFQYVAKYGPTPITSVPKTLNHRNEAITIAPDPATETIQIDKVPGDAQCLIFNMPGIIVMQANLIAGTNMLDISRLSPGMYMIQIISVSDTGNEKTIRKIIKQ